MRKWIGLFLGIILLLICAASLADDLSYPVPLDEAHFPDPIFREYASAYDKDHDGYLSQAECYSAQVDFNLKNRGISSLVGIGYFTQLEWLECSDNPISSLDLTNNVKLKSIECDRCCLQSLNITKCSVLTKLYCDGNQLETLDLSGNPWLHYLRCANPLKTLDLSHNTELQTIFCDNAAFSSLDLSQNPFMTKLTCRDGQLTSLDLSANLKMTEVYVDGNQIQEIKITACTELERLDIEDNQLKELNVNGLKKMKCIRVDRNQLTSLDVSTLEKLSTLSLDGNQLQTLDVGKNEKLEDLSCADNQLTSLKIMWETYQQSKMKSLDCHNNRLTSLNLGWSDDLVQLRCSGNLLKTLDVHYYQQIDLLARQSQPETQHITFDQSDYAIDGWGWYAKPQYGRVQWLLIDPTVTVVTSAGPIEPVKVSSIRLNREDATLTRTSKQKNPTLQLTAAVTPDDAADKSVSWTSSDPKIAKVDGNGLVTALKKGTAVITCTANDGGGASAKCTITVKEKQISKITLNKKKATLKKGKTLKLKVKTFKPSDAFNQKFKWTTSNKKVATVDKNGKVKAVGTGTCVITCTATDGSGKKATCKITVK